MKKLFLFLLFLLAMSQSAHATQLFACTSGGTFSGSIWVTTTGAQAACTGGAVPGTTNDLVLNASSGNVTIGGAAAANSFDMTGYAGTLAVGAQTLTVLGLTTIQGAFTASSGSIVAKGGVTLAATPTGTFPTISLSTSNQSLTGNGFTWPGQLIFNFTGTVTLVGSWTNTGLVTWNATTILNFNSSSAEVFNANGGLTMSNITGAAPTATIVLGGGTWSGTGTVFNNMNFAGNVTVSGTVQYGTGLLKYVSGSITTTSSTLQINSTCSLDVSAITWNAITNQNASTVTLVSNLVASSLTNNGGILTMSGAPTITVTTLSINKGITLSSNWTVSGTFTVSGNLTIAGAFSLNTLNYTQGAFSTTITSTALNISNNLSFSGNPTFLGTGTITAANLILTSGQTLTWAAGQTIVVQTNLDINTANGATTTLASGTASSKAYLTYGGTYANEQVFGATFTDIDASNGVKIYNWTGGTLTRTFNIFNVNGSNINKKVVSSYWGI